MSLAAITRVVELVDRGSPRDGRRLRRLLSAVDRAPVPVRPRLLASIAVVEPALSSLVAQHPGPLCPAYPRVDAAVAARLALGERPAEVLRGLTPREAHEALSTGCSSAVAWILRDCAGTEGVRSVPVARWLVACLADPARAEALDRTREEHTPAGVVEGRYTDRVDEITPADLAKGDRTGVASAFRAASARIYAKWCASHERDETPLAAVPSWWRPVRCARLCLSRASLIREGRELRHCVGTYAPHVSRGKTVIVSIAIRDGAGLVHRSTVDIDRRTAAVVSHRGASNCEPPALNNRAIAVLARRWKENCHG